MALVDKRNTDTFTIDGGFYVHQYTTVGSKTISVLEEGNIEILVVAGGGAGLNAHDSWAPSGGGGGGEVVHLTSFRVVPGTVTLTVGAGGDNANGGNSVFGSIQTNGGGRGGNYLDLSPQGAPGGSGGGAGRNGTAGASVKLYPAAGFGNPGGGTASGIVGAGGGGGASSAGGVATTSTGGSGGQGYSCSITGTAQVYGSGGGGGSRSGVGGTAGTNAGQGGDGEAGSQALANGKPAVHGFGGGGGGGGGKNASAPLYVGLGGRGGSGVIIVRYLPPVKIYAPISMSKILTVTNSATNNLGAFRSRKVMNKDGILTTLSAGAIKFSDFTRSSQNIVLDNLALYYDPANPACYPGTGTSLTDLSGNGRTGTLQGGASVNLAKQFVLNGASQYISTIYQPFLDNNTSYTFELWFWDDSPGGFESNTALISNYGASATTQYSALHVDTTGQVGWSEKNTNSASASVNIFQNICDGIWHHIAAVATPNELTLYFDGSPFAQTIGRPGGVITTLQNIVIGGNHLGRYQTCLLGPVRIYIRALTAEQIQRHYRIESIRPSLQLGIMNYITPTTQGTAVAIYGFRMLRAQYDGPHIKVRRGSDNATRDFYASSTGVFGTTEYGSGLSLTSWLNGATAYLETWYDQSGRGKHITQTDTSLQPTLVFESAGVTALYLNNTRSMAGPNVFDTATVTNMHMIMQSKEIVRTGNFLINLNGTEGGNPGRFSVHAPWGDGTWYFDAGAVTNQRSQSTANFTTVGSKVVFSGYKSSAEVKNGFRINGGTRLLSATSSAATVSGGIKLNLQTDPNTFANHYVYNVLIFNTKLAAADETFLETRIQ